MLNKRKPCSGSFLNLDRLLQNPSLIFLHSENSLSQADLLVAEVVDDIGGPEERVAEYAVARHEAKGAGGARPGYRYSELGKGHLDRDALEAKVDAALGRRDAAVDVVCRAARRLQAEERDE